MTDRELLELAAKAAGIDPDPGVAFITDPSGNKVPAYWLESLKKFWFPLTDDGDALRLAVKLELSLLLRHSENAVLVYGGPYGVIDEGVRGDPDAATRRAIVRAAASIAQHEQPQ